MPGRPRLVMKFGGTSVATVERIRNVAAPCRARGRSAGYDVAVVVSAMSGKTNELVGWCEEASALYDQREYDTVVASGEQVTSGLLAIVLHGHGPHGALLAGLADPDRDDLRRPWLGPHRRDPAGNLDAGFARGRDRRGVGLPGDRASLRPHHDARPRRLGHRAVALAAAIGAERCDIYTDVDGVYTTDPRIVPKARRLDKIAFEEMLEMASLGRQGAPGPLGRARHGAQGADLCAVLLRRSRAIPIPAPSSATRKTSWNSRSSPASPIRRTRRRSPCVTSPTSRASPPRSSCPSPTPTSTST